MVEKLVAFDTTSRNSNLELVEFVRAYLAKHGVECRLVHDASGKKANLYATLGPADQPGIALSGHTDVVPVDGQAWDTDPWKVTRQDGRLYGRGVSDMKSFVAIALTFVPEFMRRGLKTPINLALSYDEEVGCLRCSSWPSAGSWCSTRRRCACGWSTCSARPAGMDRPRRMDWPPP